MDYKVISDYREWTTREADHTDEWDRDDTDRENSIEGISKTGGYLDGTVSFDLVPDKPYYLLYGIYSTGDSFGHDSGRIEFVDLYESEAFAKDMQKRLETHDQKNSGYNVRNPQWSVKLKTESGKRYDFHVPWLGYFEALEYVEIKEVYLQD